MKKFLWLIILLLVSGCIQFLRPQQTTNDLAQSYQEKYPELQGSRQIVIAQADKSGAFTGLLYGLEKRGSDWAVLLDTIPGTFGSAGVAPPGEKREGDRRTPGGAFALGPAYGYDPLPGLAIPYIDLDTNHYWISASDSPQYNQLVRGFPEEKNVEKMLRDDELYEYGVVIQYNTSPAVPERGSAIFIHVGRGMDDPTLGCIAVDREDLLTLLRWLEADMAPHIVIEYITPTAQKE